MNYINKITLFFFLVLGFQLSAKDYLAMEFGVKNDGATLNTCSIQKAIDFIHENGGGRLVFESGNYVTGSIYLKSNVTIQLDYGATILKSTNPFDYVHFLPSGVKL